MKTLYLVRHAKSDWGDLSLKDIDRPLNARGLQNAPKMGMKLKEKEEIPQLIVSSPATRTKQTADLLCEQMAMNTGHIVFIENIYEASVRELLQIVNAFDNKYDSVMLVCHNMAVTYIAEYLTYADIGGFPTCGVMKINFDFDDWALISENTGEKDFFWKPKELSF